MAFFLVQVPLLVAERLLGAALRWGGWMGEVGGWVGE